MMKSEIYSKSIILVRFRALKLSIFFNHQPWYTPAVVSRFARNGSLAIVVLALLAFKLKLNLLLPQNELNEKWLYKPLFIYLVSYPF